MTETAELPGQVESIGLPPSCEKIIERRELLVKGPDFEGSGETVFAKQGHIPGMGNWAGLMFPAPPDYHRPQDALGLSHIREKVNYGSVGEYLSLFLAVADGITGGKEESFVDSGPLAAEVVRSIVEAPASLGCDVQDLAYYIEDYVTNPEFSQLWLEEKVADTTLQVARILVSPSGQRNLHVVTIGHEDDLGFVTVKKPNGQVTTFEGSTGDDRGFVLRNFPIKASTWTIPKGSRVLLSTDAFKKRFKYEGTEIMRELNSFPVGQAFDLQSLVKRLDNSEHSQDDASLIVFDLT